MNEIYQNQGDGSTAIPPQEAPKGHAYAWGKTARLITEEHILTSLKNTQGDYVAVDLCSAYPIFRQIMDGQHKQRTHKEAVGLAGNFAQLLQEPLPRNPILKDINLDEETAKELRQAFSPRKGIVRSLMQTCLFNMLYEPTSPHNLKENLKESLYSVRTIHEFVPEPPASTPNTKGTWQYMVTVDASTTLLAQVQEILGENTDAFLENTSNFFAEKLKNKLRKASFISLDYKDLSVLIEEAEQSFPDIFRKTRFFKSAKSGERHIQAVVQALPFKDSSISFISCIEGWPFYGADFGLDQTPLIAIDIARVLKPGAKAVFFPWSMQGNGEDSQKALDQTLHYWRLQDMEITLAPYTREALQEKMGDREIVLIDHSPVFQEKTDTFMCAVLEKKRKS